jgi:hypothetical protein
MHLTPPSFPVFVISVVIAALVIAVNYFGVNVPELTPFIKRNMFEALLAAYALLFIGVLFRRL